MSITPSLIVLVCGLLMYVLATRPNRSYPTAAELARITFFVGALWPVYALSYAGHGMAAHAGAW